MKTDEQFDKILAMLGERNKGIDELKMAMREVTAAKEEFKTWKPEVEQNVFDLKQAFSNLGVHVEQLTADFLSTTKRSSSLIDHPKPPPSSVKVLQQASAIAHLVATSKEATSRHDRHRIDNSHRGSGFGMVYTIPPPPPVTGAKITRNCSPILFNLGDVAHSDQSSASQLHAAFPQLNFPHFDGSNPKLWIRHCETLFSIFSLAKH